MIRARHTRWGKIISDTVAGPLMGRAFRAIDSCGEPQIDGPSILLLANHFSWWDGFLQYRLNQTAFRRRLYVMMLEDQLVKNPILARCGCYSVKKESRSMIESLRYTVGLLQEPGNLVVIFPQGQLQSQHTGHIDFPRGIDFLIKEAHGRFLWTFNINLCDYGPYRKPSLTMYHTTFPATALDTGCQARAAFNDYYQGCKRLQCESWKR